MCELTPEGTVRRALLAVQAQTRVRNERSNSTSHESRCDLGDLTFGEHVGVGIVDVESRESEGSEDVVEEPGSREEKVGQRRKEEGRKGCRRTYSIALAER